MSAWSALLLGATCAAGVDIKAAAGGRLDVDVKKAPLSAVLDCLAKDSDFKVVNTAEPMPTRGLTLSLRGKTEVQLISELMTEAGFNYALTTDKSGNHVRVLLVVGKRAAATPGGSSPTIASAPVSIPTEPENPPEAAEEAAQRLQEQLSGRANGANPAAIVAPLWPLPGPVVPTEELFPEARPLSPMTLRDSRRPLSGSSARAVKALAPDSKG